MFKRNNYEGECKGYVESGMRWSNPEGGREREYKEYDEYWRRSLPESEELQGEEDGEYPQVPKFKTELCKNWVERGRCKYGEHCMFAHGRRELQQKRHANMKYKSKECESFHKGGFCAYGEKCLFIHDDRGRGVLPRSFYSYALNHPSHREEILDNIRKYKNKHKGRDSSEKKRRLGIFEELSDKKLYEMRRVLNATERSLEEAYRMDDQRYSGAIYRHENPAIFASASRPCVHKSREEVEGNKENEWNQTLPSLQHIGAQQHLSRPLVYMGEYNQPDNQISGGNLNPFSVGAPRFNANFRGGGGEQKKKRKNRGGFLVNSRHIIKDGR